MDHIVSGMFGQPGSNVIALFAALLSFAAAVAIYALTARRERRIEKSNAYLNLEVHSSEAFRYQAENASVMRPLRQSVRPSEVPGTDDPSWEVTQNYYFQCLNLFEVCSNFRRHRIVEDEVFASWLAWFHDVLKDWYFREIWSTELRTNYTRDVRNIFDVGVEIFSRHAADDVRMREFYTAVSHLMGGCPVVAKWLDHMDEAPEWPPRTRAGLIRRSPPVRYKSLDGARLTDGIRRASAHAAVHFGWNIEGDAALAAAFAADVVARDPAYISHGEIQTGLSPDGKTWARDLASLYAADFANLEDRDLLVGRAGDGEIVAIAVVAWPQSDRTRYAVLEDLAVDPKIRSGGIGTRVVEAVMARAEARGAQWVFLESGVRNGRAHSFFERQGFLEISHVFGRRLPQRPAFGGGVQASGLAE